MKKSNKMYIVLLGTIIILLITTYPYIFITMFLYLTILVIAVIFYITLMLDIKNLNNLVKTDYIIPWQINFIYWVSIVNTYIDNL